YAGPTPADPFGGASAFDIFDAIEQAEQERALAAISPPRREAIEPEAEPLPIMAPEPEPVIAEPIAIEPETVSLAEPPAHEPPPPEPAVAIETGPVPILIDGGPEADKKRGWWRR
ncbi:MAG: ribonuclease E/G, partial [Gemmatimonadaceae bacterium]|nr:ribonuclease E/G [Acetobacteraceae bacterium]